MKNSTKSTILFIEEVGGIGGSTVCLYKMMKHLSKNKYNKVLIKYHNDTSYDIEYINDAAKYNLNQWFGPHIKHVKNKYFSPFTLLYVKFLIIIDYLHRIIATCIIILKENIDLVHVNNSLGINFPSIVAARVLRVPIISHMRNFEEVHRMQIMAYEYVNKSVAITKSVEMFYRGKFVNNSKIELIYDGIEEHEIQVTSPGCLKHEYGISESDFVTVGIVGMFMNWKGIDVFIRAMALVKDACPNVKGFIVGDCLPGDEEYKNYLIGIALELDLGDSLVFTGFRKDVYNVFSSLDIVVHASTSPEPFGRVIIEAMAMEKPVVATALGGPLEIIDHDIDGMLIPPGNPLALAETIISLVSNPNKRQQLGKNAAAKVDERFRMEDTVQKVEAIYDELLATNR